MLPHSPLVLQLVLHTMYSSGLAVLYSGHSTNSNVTSVSLNTVSTQCQQMTAMRVGAAVTRTWDAV